MKHFDSKLAATRSLIKGMGICTTLPRKQRKMLFPLVFKDHAGHANDPKIELSFEEFRELAQYVYIEMGIKEGEWMRDYWVQDDAGIAQAKLDLIAVREREHMARSEGKISFPVQ